MPELNDVLLGKYRLVRKLGAGGMGAVFEAVHEKIGKHVAVKVLHKELTQKPELVARFSREAQAAAAIGHKAIIDIYDIGTADDGSLFLVMEFLQGQNLAQVLKQNPGPLDFSHALYIACQVLSALHSAHEKGIVHRDLKPDNVFLEQTGHAYPDVKLLDFGISKMLDTGAPEDRLTRTGTIMGTPFYMAPEQARGRKELDHRVDIYAMGVIIYEALLGRVPFWADNTFALVYEILNSPITPPRSMRPDIPEALEQVILKALARDPNARFQGALEMLYALMPFLDDLARGMVTLPRGVVAQGGPGGVDSVPGMSRGPSGAGVMTPPGTVRVASTPGTPMAWTGSTSGVEPPSPRSKLGLVIGGLVVAVVLLVGGGIALAVMAGGETDEVAQPPPPVTASAERPVPVPISEEPTVAITLEGLPEGSRVTVDGQLVEGNVLRRQRSSDAHELRVEAPGLQPFTQSVTFDREQALRVTMSVASVGTARDGGASSAVGSGEQVVSVEGEPDRTKTDGRTSRTDGTDRGSTSTRRGTESRTSRDVSTTPTKRTGTRRGVPQFDTSFQ